MKYPPEHSLWMTNVNTHRNPRRKTELLDIEGSSFDRIIFSVYDGIHQLTGIS